MLYHTRFVFTPTGPAHIAHAFIAWVNKVIGRTFTYRFECSLAAQQSRAWRDDRTACCEDNLADMVALGLGPSPAEELRAQGMEPQWSVLYEYGNGITAWYYRHLDLERTFGKWPCYLAPQEDRNNEAIYLGSWGLAVAEHPWIILNRVVMDLTTGRNWIIRGDDLRSECSMYAMLATQITGDRYSIPSMVYLPTLYWEKPPKKTHYAPSSSMPEKTAGMFVKDVLAAGRTAEELFALFERICFVPKVWAPKRRTYDGLVGDVCRKQVIIKNRDWQQFMESGRIL